MKLSPAERAILANQYEILKRLGSDDADYDRMIEALRWGYESEYEGALGLYRDSEVTEADSKYVMDVLDMYRVLQAAAERHGVDTSRVVFPGFDGNNEGNLWGYANFLRKQGRWTDLDVRFQDLDSHTGTRAKYERMLSVYRPMFEEAVRRSDFETPLTLEQLNLVLGDEG